MQRFVAGSAILIFVAGLFSYLWWGRLAYDHTAFLALTYVVCLGSVAWSHWYFRDSMRQLGLATANWREALRAFGVFTGGAAALIVTTGLILGRRPGEVEGLLSYPLWAGVQQYILQNFLRLRFETIFATDHPGLARERRAGDGGSGRQISLPVLLAAASAAVIFALLHWPNGNLVILSLLAGFCWCLLFVRVPNLFASWTSQAVLGILLALFFKQGMFGGFSVGRPGFRFESYGDGVQVAAGYNGDGSAVIVTLPGPRRGHSSLVRIFDPAGRRLNEWTAFPEYDFSGHLAVGDLGFGAGDEVVAVPGPGESNPPLVRVFDIAGRLESEFLAADLPQAFGASVSVRCGKIFLGAGPGPETPAVGVAYSPSGDLLEQWDLSSETGFRNGVHLLPWPLDCGSSGPGGLLAWGAPISVNPSDFVISRSAGVVRRETFPTTYGLNLAVVTLNRKEFIAAAPGPLVGYPPWIRIFRDREPWQMVRDFVAFTDPGAAGANLAAVDLNQDGNDELVVGEGCAPGRPPTVRLLSVDGDMLRQWEAYD
jgi:hypothetical protein